MPKGNDESLAANSARMFLNAKPSLPAESQRISILWLHLYSHAADALQTLFLHIVL